MNLSKLITNVVPIFILAFFVLSEIQAQSVVSSWPSSHIDSYRHVLDVANCGEKLYVDDASLFSADDWVLLVQHRGAKMVEEECGRYGRLEEYGAAGNFELARVASVEDNPSLGDDYIVLSECPNLFYYASYSGDGTPGSNDYGYQIVKVKYYEGDLTIDGDLNAPAWDSDLGTGGVIAVVATGTITLQADIDASGAGFAGGHPNANDNSDADLDKYSYDASGDKAGQKGEGIAVVASVENAGRGAPVNGGGGGNGKNSGGGGGSNYGAGGMGGKQSSAEADMTIGGKGGQKLDYAIPKRTQAFFGGGGGGGHRSAQGVASDESKGGAGGGIILLVGSSLIADRHPTEGSGALRFITADGDNGGDAASGANGAGGGGAGGTVILDFNSITVNSVVHAGLFLNVSAKGGDGGDPDQTSSDIHGPGGGGGGGVIRYGISESQKPSTLLENVSGGKSGCYSNCTNPTPTDTHEAEDGEDGGELFDVKYPIYYGENETPI